MTGTRIRRNAPHRQAWFDDIHAADEHRQGLVRGVFNIVTATMLLLVVGLVALVAILWRAP